MGEGANPQLGWGVGGAGTTRAYASSPTRSRWITGRHSPTLAVQCKGDQLPVQLPDPQCGNPLEPGSAGDPILTMEPPGTAVRTAIPAGRARPSGPKLSVLSWGGYALTFRSCCSPQRRATPDQRSPNWAHVPSSIDHWPFAPGGCVSRESNRGHRATASRRRWPPVGSLRRQLNPRGVDPSGRPGAGEGQRPRRGQGPDPIVHVKAPAIRR